MNDTDAVAGEWRPDPTMNTASIAKKNECRRCMERGYSDLDHSEYLTRKKSFYCDVGMKACLRKIRRFFENKFRVPKVSVPKKCDFADWPEDFKANCMRIYREDVCCAVNYGQGDGLPQSEEEEANSVYRIFQVLFDNAKDLPECSCEADLDRNKISIQSGSKFQLSWR